MHHRGITNPSVSSRTEAQAERHEGLTDTLSEAAGQVKNKVQDFASGTAERLEEAWHATRTSVENAYEEVARFVQRHPLAVAAASFALGFLVSRALSDWPTDMTGRMSQSRYQDYVACTQARTPGRPPALGSQTGTNS
jgi:ElaB/YqjD/DUF883 family membrane-anchored ribosome-binding protein